MRRRIADHVSDPRHAAALDGAAAVGEAAGGDRLLVRMGLWVEHGCVVRARYRATSCAALIACAEVACVLLEAGTPPPAVTGSALRMALDGLHPTHYDRADLVAAAVQAAATGRPGSSP